MGKSCFVPLCKSRWSGGDSKIIRFHNIPKNKKLKKNWLEKILNKNKPSPNSVVCNKHFKEEDYYVDPFTSKYTIIIY